MTNFFVFKFLCSNNPYHVNVNSTHVLIFMAVIDYEITKFPDLRYTITSCKVLIMARIAIGQVMKYVTISEIVHSIL